MRVLGDLKPDSILPDRGGHHELAGFGLPNRGHRRQHEPYLQSTSRIQYGRHVSPSTRDGQIFLQILYP